MSTQSKPRGLAGKLRFGNRPNVFKQLSLQKQRAAEEAAEEEAEYQRALASRNRARQLKAAKASAPAAKSPTPRPAGRQAPSRHPFSDDNIAKEFMAEFLTALPSLMTRGFGRSTNQETRFVRPAW